MLAKFELTNLLHRMHAKDGMARQSHVDGSSLLVLYSMVTTWNVSSPTRCLVFWGTQFCCSLVSQSSCRKLDAREQTIMITFFSQETASCLYRAGYTAFALKMHTNLLSKRIVNLPSPTRQACAWKEKSCPFLPPTPPRDVSWCPL